MKSITNRNDKGEFHGYQELYYGKLFYKCFFNNGYLVDYSECYYSNSRLIKSFYI